MNNLLRGKYQIVREIARSNDIVFEALDVSLGRKIALKELNIAPSMTGQARRERIERFNREARAAGRLSHPNIVSITDFGEENGRHFIAMEYLDGQNLRDRMTGGGAVPLKEAIEITCQVLDALAYAHTKNVIHRDIKPDNIQILPGGSIKITDFGIARLTEEPALTSNGQVFGTPSYMSPEQIEGRNIDFRSDIFSMGIVLYEMLTGQKPFQGDSVISITYAVVNADPPAMPGVPTGIEQVIRRALAKNPAHRQTNAEQMKQDLRNAEQTPSLFFAANSPQQGGYTPARSSAPSIPGYAGYGGYTPPVTPPMPAANPGLPWTFNGSSAASPQIQPQISTQQSMPSAQQGLQAAPLLPVKPVEPLFVLSPGGRTFLLSIIAAALLGGGIAGGIVVFMHSYDQFKVNAGSQQIIGLINQGVAAYNARNYKEATGLFEKAKTSNPSASELSKINFNLSASLMQQAREAESSGSLSKAKSLYDKLILLTPESKSAHIGLSNVLLKLGQSDAAARERNAADASLDENAAPPTLQPNTSSISDNSNPGPSLEDRKQEASQIINDGQALWKQGEKEAAKDKWRKVIELAPGTPERDIAKNLLDQSETNSGSSDQQ